MLHNKEKKGDLPTAWQITFTFCLLLKRVRHIVHNLSMIVVRTRKHQPTKERALT